MNRPSTFENQTRAGQTGESSPAGEFALGRIAAVAEEFDAGEIAEAARSLAERVAAGRFYVACVGQFKRGKSTLLNALVGQAVLPTAVVPVTTIPTILRHGERPVARVRYRNAEWAQIRLEDVEQYVSENKNPENAKGVAALEIFLPSGLLANGMCLVDTPGLGSVFAGNAAATHAFLPHIDAAIVLIGADPPLSGEELQLVEEVAKEVSDLLFVLNKADRASEAERSAAAAFAQRVLERRLKRDVPRILEISALERLEQRGPQRDWPALTGSLEQLVEHSGRLLVRAATERGLRRAGHQLLRVIEEERGALERPLADTERRVGALKKALEDAERAAQDLGPLLAAEQQRLAMTFAEERNAFLKDARTRAHQELAKGLASAAKRHNGPAYRREVMHLAQEIARTQLLPWLRSEEAFAEEAFRKTTARFAELGNQFLRRLAETGALGAGDLPEGVTLEAGLRAQSHFQFNLIERLAAPASPLLFFADLVSAGLGFRSGILNDAAEFVDQLLEVNSARVQSDVEERVRESRVKLEMEIRSVLRQAAWVAEHALTHARAAQAAGAPAVELSLARLADAEREIRSLLPSQ